MGILSGESPFLALNTPLNRGLILKKNAQTGVKVPNSKGAQRVHARRITLLLCGLLAVATLAGAAGKTAASGDIFPFKVHKQTLDNGMKVVAIPYDSPGTVAYYVVMRTGSRDEVEAGHSGFAHFFEHMMFRGTEKYSK